MFVHVSSNCSAPGLNGFYRAAQRALVSALLLLGSALFLTATVIPGFRWRLPLPRKRALRAERTEQWWRRVDPQTGLV